MEILYKRHVDYLKKVKIAFSRNFANEIDWSDRLIGIKGTRGVGKSTFIFHYINDNFSRDKRYLYVSLDDLAFTEKTIVGLAEDFIKRGGKVLFLDDVHKYANWLQKLKRLLYVLSTLVPLQPNVNKLSRDLETSRETIMNYLNYLQDGRLIKLLHADRYRTMKRPDKIFLDNTNLMYTIAPENVNKGNLRETFFYNQVNSKHFVHSSKRGDFLVDEKYTFEIGGKSKTNEQIKGLKNAFIAADDIETGFENKILLWLFGFL